MRGQGFEQADFETGGAEDDLLASGRATFEGEQFLELTGRPLRSRSEVCHLSRPASSHATRAALMA
jgi:hypothetical protein